jgi:hypothetical protein
MSDPSDPSEAIEFGRESMQNEPEDKVKATARLWARKLRELGRFMRERGIANHLTSLPANENDRRIALAILQAACSAEPGSWDRLCFWVTQLLGNNQRNLEIVQDAIRDLYEESLALTVKAPQQLGEGAGRQPKRKRRRATTRRPTPLTAKQTEAMQLVAEHKGNIAAAARAAGKSRAAMSNLYKKATAKLGKKAIKHFTQRLPTDVRGQETIAADKEE